MKIRDIHLLAAAAVLMIFAINTIDAMAKPAVPVITGKIPPATGKSVNASLRSPVIQTYVESSHGRNVSRASVAAAGYAVGNCAHCHEQHASMGGKEASGQGGKSLGLVEQYLCYHCHGNGSEGKDTRHNIENEFNKTYAHGNNGTVDYMLNYDDRHRPLENTSSAFDAANKQRHAECVDCHNPHAATPVGTDGYGSGPIIGATGVDPTNSSAGVPPVSYTFVTITDAAQEYKICFKCHSDWAGSGTGSNLAIAFNPANDSKHCVESDKNCTSGIYMNATFNSRYAGLMMPRFKGADNAKLRAAMMRCSDCHGTDNAGIGPSGPHGSTIAKILKVPSGSPYTTWNSTVNYLNNSGEIWCFNCHASDFAGSGFYGGMQNLHVQNNEAACQDCHIQIPHGSTENGTANQRKHLLKPTVFAECFDQESSGNYSLVGCGS